MLASLSRSSVGPFRLEKAQSVSQIDDSLANFGKVESLPSYLPFDRLLDHFQKIQIAPWEASDLISGKQRTFTQLTARFPKATHEVALYLDESLVAVASKRNESTPERGIQYSPWALDRVFAKELP